MGYAQDSGYTPSDIATIMNSIMANINNQFGTSYTSDTFIGTNFYKYFYALAQKYQANEIKTSEIFQKLQDYFAQINARIDRPVVTNPGIIERLAKPTTLTPAGYIASVKPMILADAGKINICVDTDDGVHAAGNITITSFANLLTTTPDTVGIAGTTFTAQAGAATLGAAVFQAATSNAATAASLALQINSHATASTLVRATAIGAVVNIQAIHGGTGGNSLALAYTDNGGGNIGATKSGTVLSGGVANAAYANIKAELGLLISQITVGGAITQGLEVVTIVLSNGQSFDFKYWLPNRIEVLLRLTTTLSDNNQVVVGSPDDVKIALLNNIEARYRLGRDFEPQRYYSIADAPWTASVLLEWSIDNGASYSSAIYQSAFDALFDVKLENITLVED